MKKLLTESRDGERQEADLVSTSVNQRLEKSLEWISETSIQQAEQIEQAILERIEIIRVHPERHPPDKYKRNNPGIYRAFEIHSYRISYHYTENEIRILRFRHVKQEPKEY